MTISVVVPACNEAASLERTIGRAVDALRPLFECFEIIVVDDASRDGTGIIADRLAREHPEVRVVHNATNLGQGASLLKGFRDAAYDLVTHDAADYPFDLRDLDKMLLLLSDADVVVAARSRRAGYTLYRRVLSVLNVALLRLLFGLRLRDYNFVQLYRKCVLQALEIQARSTGFVTPEILIRAHDLGYRITEIEIDYHPREAGVGTAGQPRVVMSSLRDMLTFWLTRTLRRRGDRRPETMRSVRAGGRRSP